MATSISEAPGHVGHSRDETARGSGTALIAVRTVAQLIDAHPSTVWRKVADGTLPRPVKIGGMTRWSKAEVEAVIEAALAKRDKPKAA